MSPLQTVGSFTKLTAYTAATFAITATGAQAMVPTTAQLDSLQRQLEGASARIAALAPSGAVLGASTTSMTVPVRPVCRLSTDKKSYTVGEKMVVTWKTTGAATAAFVSTAEEKDGLPLPTGTQAANGTVSLTAAVMGLPHIALTATSETGHTVTCAKTVSILDEAAGKKDVRVGKVNALILQKLDRLAALNEKKVKIDAAMSVLQGEVDKLKASLALLPGDDTGASTTKKVKMSDIATVTQAVTDPNPDLADDEYTLYTLTTHSDTTIVVKVAGNATVEVRNKAFKAAGFSGSVTKLLKMVTPTE